MREIPDARFLIVGQGEFENTLRHQIKHLNLEKHVVLTGFRQDTLSLQKRFDIFVMCLLSERLRTSTLDAMAYGRPVMATLVGRLPEVVDHRETGLLVPARDSAPTVMIDETVEAYRRVVHTRRAADTAGPPAAD